MYSMPHSLDRKYQLETYNKIKQSEHPNIIIQSPTGSGKSAWAAQLAADGYRVLVLVKTKSLQVQYAENYNFSLLYGKNNYPCLKRKQEDDAFFLSERSDYQIPTADLCNADKNEYVKFCQHTCPYPQARRDFINSQAGVLNYSKALLDKRLVQEFRPDYLVLDECHELSDIVVNYSGIEVKWSSWIREYISSIKINSPQQVAFYQGREFLQQFKQNLMYRKPLHPSKGGKPKKYQFWENQLRQTSMALELLYPNYWYITSNDERFLAKPLTARFDYSGLFNIADKVILMSATIGQSRYFVRELGIEQYEFLNVPNIWSAALRPIYDYNQVKIVGSSTYQERKEHAQIIANCLNNQPRNWNGLVHVTSKNMAREHGQWLRDKTKRPIWIPQNGLGTEEALEQWQSFDRNNEGAIAVTWQFFSGADLGDIAINISARVPYPDFSDSFGNARFKFDPGCGRIRVGNSLEQQMGRNRRGYENHYGLTARKYNAIVDSKWSKLQSALSKDFLDSIRKV